MVAESFEHHNISSLRKRKKLSYIALLTVWIGGIIGVSAAISKTIQTGDPEILTFIMSLLAVIASIPVLLERQKISRVLKTRNQLYLD